MPQVVEEVQEPLRTRTTSSLVAVGVAYAKTDPWRSRTGREVLVSVGWCSWWVEGSTRTAAGCAQVHHRSRSVLQVRGLEPGSG
jgi:hypothetical protein